ncbi:MAG: hypothetical protein LLF76_09740 [Planctomycetaceae bacterium]|nr:hypothetical protein [Planctomycetaceae bacterium]
MHLVLVGVGLVILTGFVALFLRNAKHCMRFSVLGVLAGSVCFMSAAVPVLTRGQQLSLQLPWQVPYGSFYVVLDGLSALFLVCIALVCAVAAIYSVGYMSEHGNRRLGMMAFAFNMLVAGMVMVVLARNSMLFLVAWEIMSLASYFLVTFHHEEKSVRQAGWIYLIATHIGTAFLLAFFMLLAKVTGTPNFEKGDISGTCSSILFVLALIGFGTKAGIMPLHVWLPEAHPAAPSHVSAVMSGVMIKMGIYGIARTLAILPSFELWWACLLIALGAGSGILGVLLALAQHDLKRLLAYHSVENIGIILMGLGIGVLGTVMHAPAIAVAGFAGGLLHVVNHAVFKGLLFLGAGAVVRAAKTHEIDRLGGLQKQMPVTAAAFLIGAVAICGLPPLNGFVSEFLIYSASFKAGFLGSGAALVSGLIIVAALAMIGALAAACFTKVFGIVFLGEPRSKHAEGLSEPPASMCAGEIALAACCIIIGLASPVFVRAIGNPVLHMNVLDPDAIQKQLAPLAANLLYVVITVLFFLACIAAFMIIRNRLFSRIQRAAKSRPDQAPMIGQAPTWDCGYMAPTARMQYTGSSFAQPILDLFQTVLQSRSKKVKIADLFPREADFHSHTPDLSSDFFYQPLFRWTSWFISKMRWLQYGVVQLYVLYIMLTLIILLLWKVR